VTKGITDPETKESVWKREQAALLVRGGRRSGGTPNRNAMNRSTLPISAIGSGSDFAGFLDHLGISCLNVGYGGEDRGGTYHSAYDTPWFTDHFGDKEEVYGPVMAQTAGTIVMRFANADILPYDFRNLAQTIRGYDGELKALVKSLQTAAKTREQNLSLHVFALTNDPQKKGLHSPAALVPPPDMDFSALDDAISALDNAAARFAEVQAPGHPVSTEKLASANAQLTMADRKLLSDQGLPRRPWVRNTIYAPGTYAGYGVSTIPGVREALEQGRYPEAKEQLAIVSKLIHDQADYIEQIASSLQ
jgi:N-acetylated-alpha-linked acidic dipeptidase